MIAKEMNEKRIEKFVQSNLEYCKDANKDVLYFIADFYYANGKTEDEAESLRKQFRAGYCYHFATILKDVFKRGTVCWCAPISHIVWCDEDGTPYDIEGVNFSDCEEYVPIEYLGESLKSFIHLRSYENIPVRNAEEILESYRRNQKASSFDEALSILENRK